MWEQVSSAAPWTRSGTLARDENASGSVSSLQWSCGLQRVRSVAVQGRSKCPLQCALKTPPLLHLASWSRSNTCGIVMFGRATAPTRSGLLAPPLVCFRLSLREWEFWSGLVISTSRIRYRCSGVSPPLYQVAMIELDFFFLALTKPEPSSLLRHGYNSRRSLLQASSTPITATASPPLSIFVNLRRGWLHPESPPWSQLEPQPSSCSSLAIYAPHRNNLVSGLARGGGWVRVPSSSNGLVLCNSGRHLRRGWALRRESRSLQWWISIYLHIWPLTFQLCTLWPQCNWNYR